MYYFMLLIGFNISLVYCTALDAMIPHDYDRLKPPIIYDKPVSVRIKLLIVRILSVDEVKQTFTVDMLYQQLWSDPRLKSRSNETIHQSLILDSTLRSRLWVPDTYFSNALSGSVLSVLNPTMYLEISNISSLSLFSRVNVKFSCDMDLFSYPQDIQECYIDIISLTHNTENVILKWEGFDLLSYYYPKLTVFSHASTSWNQSTLSGTFSCLRGSLKLFRRLSYYIIRIYGPSFLVVITSFVGFWIPVLAWPGRVAIGVTPLLTLVTMQTQVNAEINVSYVVALHIWMIFSTFFVFMSLIEFAAAISYAYRYQDNEDISSFNTSAFDASRGRIESSVDFLLEKIYGKINWYKCPLNRNKIDYISRILFPTVYFLFLITYILVFVVPPYFS